MRNRTHKSRAVAVLYSQVRDCSSEPTASKTKPALGTLPVGGDDLGRQQSPPTMFTRSPPPCRFPISGRFASTSSFGDGQELPLHVSRHCNNVVRSHARRSVNDPCAEADGNSAKMIGSTGRGKKKTLDLVWGTREGADLRAGTARGRRGRAWDTDSRHSR